MLKQKYIYGIVSFFLLLAVILPGASQASAFSYSAWIPYWNKTAGSADVEAHPGVLSEVSPFGYSVRSDGTLADTAGISSNPWTTLIQQSVGQGSKIIPTIMWSDQNAIYTVLSSSTLRIQNENAIVAITASSSIAGVDIDYENKSAATENYFSKFLTELSAALHKKGKTLTCDIEARTPLSSRFTVIPSDIAYSNDYTVINKVCDEVRIMAYDQDNVDIKLNAQKGGTKLYQPIADTAWAQKVVAETLKSISAKKIVLAVPTYGREYLISTTTKGIIQYQAVQSVTYDTAVSMAASLGITPTRNSAGEMSYTFASSTGTYFVDYDDAIAIANKINVAKSYGLKGVAVFKFDGQGDPDIWTFLK